MKKVVIAGYYGYKNSGDDAILASICDDLRAVTQSAEIIILSKTPSETEAEYGARSVNRFSFSQVVKALRGADLLLMGGGSLLQDSTSSRSLYYYLGLIALGRWHGCKVMIYANGIGPIGRRFNRWLVGRIVNRIETITLREHLSLEVLTQLGIKRPKIAVTADPVFNLFCQVSPTERDVAVEEGVPLTKKWVGVMFRQWQYQEIYVEKMAEVCDRLVKSQDVHIIFIPMKYPVDVAIGRRIAAGMTSEATVIDKHYNATELMTFIGRLDLVLSMRLHALIYASIYYVPMIGFDYDPKVTYYIEELGMRSVNQMQHIRVDEVESMAVDMLERPIPYRQCLQKNVQRLKEEAKQNRRYLEELLK